MCNLIRFWMICGFVVFALSPAPQNKTGAILKIVLCGPICWILALIIFPLYLCGYRHQEREKI